MRYLALISLAISTLSCWSQTSEHILLKNTALLDELMQLALESGKVDTCVALYAEIDSEIQLYSDAYPSLSNFASLKVAFLNGRDVMNTMDSLANKALDTVFINKYDDSVTMRKGILLINMNTGEFEISFYSDEIIATYLVRDGLVVERIN